MNKQEQVVVTGGSTACRDIQWWVETLWSLFRDGKSLDEAKSMYPQNRGDIGSAYCILRDNGFSLRGLF